MTLPSRSGTLPSSEPVSKTATFWPLASCAQTLSRNGLRVALRSPGGQQKEVQVIAAMRQTKKITNLTMNGASDIWDLLRESETRAHLGRARWADAGDVSILKFPGFYFDDGEMEDIIRKARKRKSLIVDLRGNPGGSVETLKWFLGGVFDKDVKVGDQVTRNGSKVLMAKSRRQNAFSGKLVVLVDSKSALASELFARVVQLEKRGIVLGDKTAGAVMESKRFSCTHGMDTIVFYGASITDADLVMTDGNSLERTGVTPDELPLPNAEDLASGRDPVMAHAIELCGSKMTPEAARSAIPVSMATANRKPRRETRFRISLFHFPFSDFQLLYLPGDDQKPHLPPRTGLAPLPVGPRCAALVSRSVSSAG